MFWAGIMCRHPHPGAGGLEEPRLWARARSQTRASIVYQKVTLYRSTSGEKIKKKEDEAPEEFNVVLFRATPFPSAVSRDQRSEIRGTRLAE